ncbi:TPA: hypothetical protein ACJEU7_003026 [Acinetobacter baumannii]|uniref:hypothetical protein n=1 Tax=Acinetobacter baumannii TaxID=470 RepID=UPI002256AE6A|nr:hypothetical protein [Acinetobacter baumannii]MCX3035249.1 hypothetical protein [Acinetobacter baumannii]
MEGVEILFEKHFNNTNFKPYSNDRVLCPSDVNFALFDHPEASKFLYGLTRKSYIQFKKDVLQKHAPLTGEDEDFIRQICRERTPNNNLKVVVGLVRNSNIVIYYGVGPINKNADRYFEIYKGLLSTKDLISQHDYSNFEYSEMEFGSILNVYCQEVGKYFELNKIANNTPIPYPDLHVAHQIAKDMRKHYYRYERLSNCIRDSHYDNSILVEYDQSDLILESYKSLQEEIISTAKLCYIFGFNLKTFLDNHRKDWFKLNVFNPQSASISLHIFAAQEHKEFYYIVADLRGYELCESFMHVVRTQANSLDIYALETDLQQHFVSLILLWDYLTRLNRDLETAGLNFIFKPTVDLCA